MNIYYILEDVPCEGARNVRPIDGKGINQAISDLYKGEKLPNNYFREIRMLVSPGRNTALLHNMQNFRICRSDIAAKISAIAGGSV